MQSEASPSAKWQPPKQFNGYLIEGELDGGGMGVIYKAYRMPENKLVAIKFMLDQSQYKRFQREANTGRLLQHRNFVRFHDVGEVESRLYIVMDFIDGEPLKRYLKRVNLSSDQRLVLFQKIVFAISYAHKQGIIHRDLKPANILIDNENEPVILDFGLAKSLSLPQDEQTALTITGQILGTPGYMSPEQARGEIDNQDERSDIFCLGIILYEILTARNPFEGEDFLSICYKIAHQPAPPIEKILSGIPPKLAFISNKCLMRKKEQRYQTAQELANDIEEYLEDRMKAKEQPTVSYKTSPLLLMEEPDTDEDAVINLPLHEPDAADKPAKIICVSCGALNPPQNVHCHRCKSPMRKKETQDVETVMSPQAAAMNATPPPTPPPAAQSNLMKQTGRHPGMKNRMTGKVSLASVSLPKQTPYMLTRDKEVEEDKSKKKFFFRNFWMGAIGMPIAIIPMTMALKIPFYACFFDLFLGALAEFLLHRGKEGAWKGGLLFSSASILSIALKYFAQMAPSSIFSSLEAWGSLVLAFFLGTSIGLFSKRFRCKSTPESANG